MRTATKPLRIAAKVALTGDPGSALCVSSPCARVSSLWQDRPLVMDGMVTTGMEPWEEEWQEETHVGRPSDARCTTTDIGLPAVRPRLVEEDLLRDVTAGERPAQEEEKDHESYHCVFVST